MMEATFTATTQSPEETEAIGAALWPMLSDGGVLALHGELAAGKTCFVRGMAQAAGAGDMVHSPTFTLVNQYQTSPPLYHLDLYRLESPEQLYDLGWEDWCGAGGVLAVEWPERAEGLMPETRLDVMLEHGPDQSRRIAIANRGVLPEGWESALVEVQAD